LLLDYLRLLLDYLRLLLDYLRFLSNNLRLLLDYLRFLSNNDWFLDNTLPNNTLLKWLGEYSISITTTIPIDLGIQSNEINPQITINLQHFLDSMY